MKHIPWADYNCARFGISLHLTKKRKEEERSQHLKCRPLMIPDDTRKES